MDICLAEKKLQILSGVDFLDAACKVLFAADIYRQAVEAQEKCREMPEDTPQQRASKTKMLTKADKQLADITKKIKNLK